MVQGMRYQAVAACLLLMGGALSTAAHADEAAERAAALSQKLSIQSTSPAGGTQTSAVLQSVLGQQVSGVSGAAPTVAEGKK